MDVAAIAVPDVLRALEPLWKTKTITADRVRSRVESVLDWAVVRGHRSPGTNPAKWPGVLDQVLPPPRKVAPIRSFAAMPYADVPAFMRELRGDDTLSARALEFAILTAARSGEVRQAEWSEIDFEQKIWTVPAPHTKTRREHRIPLAPAVIDLLQALPREKDNAFIFVGTSAGSGLSRMAFQHLLARLGCGDTVHGFRSSFRDWSGEVTSYPHDVCEAALAHVRGDQSVRAYARGDLFDKRRKLMDAWAEYCATQQRPRPATSSGSAVAAESAGHHVHRLQRRTVARDRGKPSRHRLRYDDSQSGTAQYFPGARVVATQRIAGLGAAIQCDLTLGQAADAKAASRRSAEGDGEARGRARRVRRGRLRV
jgi:integrase